MIALFTDFGLADPYVGQLHATLSALAPDVPIIDLFHSVPSFDIQAGAYLLPAYTQYLPSGCIVVAIVDPGVGGPRRAVFLQAENRTYVGPDNGLFSVIADRAGRNECFEITWRPARLSASFHGRDLFAPIAAMLATGQTPPSQPATLTSPPGSPWPADLPRILYIDHYGNAVSGLRGSAVPPEARLEIRGQLIARARTFADARVGEVFWYENANGLVEIAANQDRAQRLLGLVLNDPIVVQ